jgi:diguanylate cyclase (GGDEF)-like protein
MKQDKLGAWLTSPLRVLALTTVGTALCIAVALIYDSYSFSDGSWRWGSRPWNNVLLPLVLAPPLLYLLLSKLRALSIAHHRLEVVASTDSLTSCLNRAAFSTLVEAYLEKFGGHVELGRGALLVIDVDHFKRVNDTYGHEAGDDALRLIAQAIRHNLRERDLLGRMGGEEFNVFLPGATEPQCRGVAERVRETVQRIRFAPLGEDYPLTVSVGGAQLGSSSSFSSLYRTADRLLYEAKRNGRNQVVVAPAETGTTVQ